MVLSASEQATLDFYQWEYKGRGYYHFESQVDIEPPFTPFRFKSYTDDQQIDDGKVPSLLNMLGKLFDGKPKEVKKEKSTTLIPNPLGLQPKLTGFSISFGKDWEISSVISTEFLNMLCFSDNSISFEILGTYHDITIQIICSEKDRPRIESQFLAYFSTSVIKDITPKSLGFDFTKQVAIADFGLCDEFMRPIEIHNSFNIDPLTSIVASLDTLQFEDIALFQIIFKGVTAPWVKSILNSVSDGIGGSFFLDSPEMLKCTEEKVLSPLFSSVIRIATQGNSDNRSQYLAKELTKSITSVSTSRFNKLIPLSNKGYNYEDHLYNIYHRTTNRLGMILNSEELASLVHYPNKTVVSSKLGLHGGKTKTLPSENINRKYVLGINQHNGNEVKVTIGDESRLRHTYIIGATGVGKSTLIANMMIEDMKIGNGCALFDPHGDIVEDILLRIPESRKNDVIIIDPSDSDFPIGFNLLKANTDVEKIVLSSDLVSAFKRHATAWGDNMTAVLSNAINTFLESEKGGTLIELKRFLLEDTFRIQFLKTVEDQSIHYYWQYEYPMVKKGIAPLLTRIDTFLRPKIVRYMLAQNKGIDFRKCIEEKKIVLIKLSQGLIGEDNSYLLGSLFLSKLNQAAQGRQMLSKSNRHPFYVYLDEFQNFITPSITSILSGARKYGLGLILAHQELSQIEDTKTLGSVISNPNIRICFRLGDSDAKKLESGFSYFEQEDLQSLGIGQAIMRIGSSKNDFNIETYPLPEIDLETAESIKETIIQNTRYKYAKPKVEIQKLIEDLFPKHSKNQILKKNKLQINSTELIINHESKDKIPFQDPSNEVKESVTNIISQDEKNKLIEAEELSTKNRDHIYLQTRIKKLGQERGYLATIEKETVDGKRIDITLEKGIIKIAFEISITNTPEYEVKNIRKCLSNGFLPIVMVSKNKNHLNKIERLAIKELSKKDINYVLFIQPNEITDVLDGIQVKTEKSQEVVKGFRITTEFEESNISNPQNIREHIAKLLFKHK